MIPGHDFSTSSSVGNPALNNFSWRLHFPRCDVAHIVQQQKWNHIWRLCFGRLLHLFLPLLCCSRAQDWVNHALLWIPQKYFLQIALLHLVSQSTFIFSCSSLAFANLGFWSCDVVGGIFAGLSVLNFIRYCGGGENVETSTDVKANSVWPKMYFMLRQFEFRVNFSCGL